MRILSLLFVLVLASAGARAQTWNEFRSAEGRYRVEMPGTPKIKADVMQLKGGEAAPFVQALATVGEFAYLVTYMDYSQKAVANTPPQQTLVDVRDSAAKGAKLVSDRTLAVAGYSAREYLILDSDTLFLIRSAMADTRLYQVIFAYKASQPQPVAARRFVDSFNILSQQ
jgi:hypothetical protein